MDFINAEQARELVCKAPNQKRVDEALDTLQTYIKISCEKGEYTCEVSGYSFLTIPDKKLLIETLQKAGYHVSNSESLIYDDKIEVIWLENI